MTRTGLALLALLAVIAWERPALGAGSPSPKKPAARKKPAPKPTPPPEPEPAPVPFLDLPSADPVPAPPAPAIAPAPVEPAPAPAPRAAEPSRPPRKPFFERVIGHAGGYFQLGWGQNSWSLDRAQVASQVGGQDDVGMLFDQSLRDGQAGSLRAGYNVLGQAHLGVNFLATGWEVTTIERGGGGFLGGEIGWHPLSLVSAILRENLPGERWYDLWLEGGYGYSIVGKKRALDGTVWSFGVGTEGYPAPWVSIGLRATWYFPSYDRYIIDYDHRDLPGMTIDLPQGSGGSFLTWTGFLALHFGMPAPER